MEAQRSGWRRIAAGVALLAPAALAAWLFSPVLGFPFLALDDDWFVLANPTIRDWSPRGIAALFLGPQHDFRYFPLTYLLHALDMHLAGPDASAFHRTNLLLHLANVVLVGLVVRRLRFGAAVATVTATLFAVHPLQVEPVAWVMGRNNLAFFVFLLPAVLAWVARVDAVARGDGRRALAWYAATLAAFAASLLAKFSAAPLPALLFLVEERLLALRGEPGGPPARRLLPLLPFAALVLVAWVANQHAALRSPFHWEPGFAASHWALLCAHAFFSYLRDAAAPLALSILRFQPGPGEPLHWSVHLSAVAATAAFAATAIAFARRRGRDGVSFGMAWYFVAIAPMAMLPALTDDLPILVADRYFYPAAPGVFLAVSSLFVAAWTRSRARGGAAAAAVGIAGIAVVAGLVLRAESHLETFSSSVAMLRNVTRFHPSDEAWYRLAMALEEEGDREGALAALDEGRRATRRVLFSRLFRYQYRLAALEREAGRPADAARWLEAAIAATPNTIEPVSARCPFALLELADLQAAAGNLEVARALAEEASRASCDGADLHLGMLLSFAPGQALRIARAGVEARPTDAVGWRFLAAVEEAVGDGPRAALARARAASLAQSR